MTVPGDNARTRRSFFIAATLAAIGLAVLLGLGIWQLQRKTWKEALIGALQERIVAAPVELPPASDWPRMTQNAWEFRRVKVSLEYLDKPNAWLFASSSALRDDIKAPGYFVFAPARLPSGAIVVVNTGWVPERQHRQFQRNTGKAEIVGYLRWPEQPNWFVSSHNPSGEAWFVRDHREMAKVREWGEPVAPFHIDQESPVPPSGLPKPAPLTVKLRNDHFGYALTWFGLAATLIAVFGFWAWGRQRELAGP